MKASAELFTPGVLFDDFGGMQAKRDLQSIVASTLQRSRAQVDYNHDIAFAILSDEEAEGQELHPEENRLLNVRTHPKKRSRWRRGRAAAHSALSRLGIDDSLPITQGAAGEPIWPNGVSGSITHCNEYSIAAVLPSLGRFFLGIDLEDLHRIEDLEIESVVCRPN